MTRDMAPERTRSTVTVPPNERPVSDDLPQTPSGLTSGDGREPVIGHERAVAGEPVAMLPLPRTLARSDRAPSDERPEGGRAIWLPAARHREPVSLGTDRYQLRGSEVQTLTLVGTFRIVFARDLEHYPDERALRADLRSLHRQQLIERGTLVLKDERAPVEVVTLTAAGKRLLESHRAPNDAQRFYAGWVRSVDLAHDAGVYRMVIAERRRIESAGGHLTRIVLEHELKANVHQVLNRPQEHDYADPTHIEERAALGAAHDLPMANGHLRFPDARLEYETATGERAHVDLELVTNSYRGAHLAAKQAAGFTLYRLGGAQSGRGGIPHDPRRRGSVWR